MNAFFMKVALIRNDHVNIKGNPAVQHTVLTSKAVRAIMLTHQ